MKISTQNRVGREFRARGKYAPLNTVLFAPNAKSVTAGRDRHNFRGYWCNGSTEVSEKTMEASEKTVRVRIAHTPTDCHPKRSLLCGVAAEFINALGGRDIAIRTRIAKPNATGNGFPARSNARPLHFRGCTGFDFTSAPTVACRGCLVCRVTNRGKNRLPLIAVTADSMRSALDSLPTTVRASVPVNRSVRSLPNAEQADGGWRRKLPLIKHVDTVGVPVEDGGSTPPTSTFSSAWRNTAALTSSRSHSVVTPNYRYVTGRAVRVSPHRSAVRRRTDTAIIFPPRSAGFVEGLGNETSRASDGIIEPGRGGSLSKAAHRDRGCLRTGNPSVW